MIEVIGLCPWAGSAAAATRRAAVQQAARRGLLRIGLAAAARVGDPVRFRP